MTVVAGGPIAYYVGFTFPSYYPRGKKSWGTASVQWAQDRHVFPSGDACWSGPFETLVQITVEDDDDWMPDESPLRRSLWRAALAHRAGRAIADDELTAWLTSGPPSPGCRATVDQVDRFLAHGFQPALL